MTVLKRLYLGVLRQLRARKALYQLRDRRAFHLVLGRLVAEAAELWVDVLPFAPRTMLDVGAHRGDVAAGLAALYRPEFVGLVEPLPDLAGALRTRTFAPRQAVFECVLGAQSGVAHMNVLASRPSSSLLEVTPESSELFGRSMSRIDVVEVRMRTLDSILEECALEELDLLKVDVQGYEGGVFAGGKKALGKTRAVVTEVSFFEHYKGQLLFGDLYQVLRQQGFELSATFGFIRDSIGMPLQCDAVFLNRSLASACSRRGR